VTLMSTDPELSKPTWRPFFDRFSKSLAGESAEVEIASLKLGNQIAAEWLPLFGITYDPADDIVEIAMEGYDHLINRPRAIHVKRDATRLTAIEVIDSDDVHHLVKLREPLALPG
jgi:Family of unknown function (DUF5335)